MNAYPSLDYPATRRRQRRFALELIFSLLIIALLIAAFLQQAPIAAGKARLTVMLSALSEGRVKVIEHLALTGGWLDETPPDDDANSAWGAWARVGAIRQGAIQIEVHNRKPNHTQAPSEWWSVRPAIAADDAPTVLWICADRAPPAGFRAFGENLTTLSPELLFRFC